MVMIIHMRIAVAAAVSLLICGTANAQEPTRIYCIDSTNTIQPMKYVNTANLEEGFRNQFHWKPFLTRLTEKLGRLVFSRDGTTKSAEWIAYDVEEHEGGLMFRVMHVHLPKKTEDVLGNEMCMKTQMIAMGQ